jgi:hypothetical protein
MQKLHPDVVSTLSFGTLTDLILVDLLERKLPASQVETLAWAERRIDSTPHAPAAFVSTIS